MGAVVLQLKEDKEICKKLLVKFLKLRGLTIYMYRRVDIPCEKIFSMPTDAFYKLRTLGVMTEFELQVSQLWRFYLLEHLDCFRKDIREALEKDIKYALVSNGYRDSQEVKDLFKKHFNKTH